jgi:hypothetical protein
VNAPRPSSGSGGDRRLLWVAAAVVLVGALALTGRLLEQDSGTGAPVSTAPAASASDPRTSRPVNAVEVEGVAMVRTSRAFRASCRQAADRLGFAVPCPDLLPIPASGAAPSRLCQELCRQGELLWFPLEAFVVPPGSTGAPGSLGALAILATPDPKAAAGPALWCPDHRQLATPTVSGRPAVLATCPPGFQGWSQASVLLHWSRRGTFITLALRGPSERNQRLLVALAAGLALVPPRG